MTALSGDGALPVLSGRRVGRVAAVVVVLVVLVGSGLWWWLAGSGLERKDRVTGQLQVVQLALSVGVAGGGIFALYLAYRRQAHQELVSRAAEHDAAERRVTELYTKAVDQLGSERAPVRLGGLYALERLAQANPDQRQTIVNVLCAYLRMPYAVPVEGADGFAAAVEERQVRRTAQVLLRNHLRPGDGAEPAWSFWADIDLDLGTAVLVELDLRGCRVRGVNFVGARFEGRADFSGTRFGGGAMFNESVFTARVMLVDAEFAGLAAFRRAEFLGGVWLSGARFVGRAVFEEASFAVAPTGDATFELGVPEGLGSAG